MVKRVIIVIGMILFMFSGIAGAEDAKAQAKKIMLMISEQNIEGPKTGWWMGQVDLSATEAVIARKLIEGGLEIIEPSFVSKTVQQKPAFQTVDISDVKSVELGKLSNADYLVLGKAIASAGGNVPQSSMRSCFANLTVKVIKVSDGKIIGYLDGSGNSVHMDVITGGKEALTNAASDISTKIMDVINKANAGGK
jgi:hypothetical protein